MSLSNSLAATPPNTTSKTERRRTIIAASAGNFVEWYDAGVYGIVAVALSKKLFPSDVSASIALLNTYAVFAISYLLRPVGGIIFGHIALSQIKRTGQGGRGLAIAGLIAGYILVALTVVLVIALAATDSSA